ncbi:uncharacterized protein LOC141908838 [Tubulanus polymorphus]|uniref:uncharacterized protein LOC141908838 n=1 Tax=Tubulanus polymorphus TaxID=672921 RepID=UPI003DA66D70
MKFLQAFIWPLVFVQVCLFPVETDQSAIDDIRDIDRQFHLNEEPELKQPAPANDQPTLSQEETETEKTEARQFYADIARKPPVSAAMEDKRILLRSFSMHSMNSPEARGDSILWIIVASTGSVIVVLFIAVIAIIKCNRKFRTRFGVQTVFRENDSSTMIDQHELDEFRSPIDMFCSGRNDDVKNVVMSIPGYVLEDKSLFVRSPSVDENGNNACPVGISTDSGIASDAESCSVDSVDTASYETVILNEKYNNKHSAVSIDREFDDVGRDFDDVTKSPENSAAVLPIDACHLEVSETDHECSSCSYDSDDLHSICFSDIISDDTESNSDDSRINYDNFEKIESWKNYTDITPAELVEDVDQYIPSALKSRPSLEFYTDETFDANRAV